MTYASSADEINESELIGLEMASKELGCSRRTVITWDYHLEGDFMFVSLWKWLLDTDSER
jgi:predicted AAA+ superfamily ATPase